MAKASAHLHGNRLATSPGSWTREALHSTKPETLNPQPLNPKSVIDSSKPSVSRAALSSAVSRFAARVGTLAAVISHGATAGQSRAGRVAVALN